MAITFCSSCGTNIKNASNFCSYCGKPLQVKWWFTKSSDDPKGLTLCLDGEPFCTSKAKSPPCVVKVKALSPGHVQVVFKDDTTHDLALVFFDGDKCDFQHSLKASMDSESFAEQFAEDLKALTNTSTALQVKWWFTKSSDDPKGLTLCLDGEPFCTSKEKNPPCVVKVKALSPGHVQVVFEDDTTHDLALVFFDGDKGDFQHSLKASMDSERFAEQFALHLKALTNTYTGHWQRNLLFAVIGAPLAVGAAVVALPVIGFGAAGITAGSYAASMMSAAAVASGGGVATGGLVATLQAAGVVGLGAGATAAVGAAGGAAAAAGSAGAGMVQDKLKKWWGS